MVPGQLLEMYGFANNYLFFFGSRGNTFKSQTIKRLLALIIALTAGISLKPLAEVRWTVFIFSCENCFPSIPKNNKEWEREPGLNLRSSL